MVVFLINFQGLKIEWNRSFSLKARAHPSIELSPGFLSECYLETAVVHLKPLRLVS